MLDGYRRIVRDQAPLHAGHIEFAPGFSYDDLVALLNGLVFFWPGNDAGPIREGQNHFKRYAAEQPVILRIRTEDLIASAGWGRVRGCKYNSGAPRTTNGRRSPRGPDTFFPLGGFNGTRSSVKEIVVEGGVDLPSLVEIATQPSGPFNSF